IFRIANRGTEPGRLVSAVAASRHQHDAARHRLPCRNRRARRRRTHADQSRRAGRDPLEDDPRRRLRLSLRAWRPDDGLARRLRHERRGDGAAARWTERRAHFKIEGKWNDDLMTQVKAPEEIPLAESN